MKKLIPLSLILILVLPFIYQTTPLEVLKLRTFDALIPEQNESGNFVILNITENDIANEGGYPLSRQTLAQIHINLLRRGAMGVGWVMAFPQPDRFGGDFEFMEALSFSPSVLAMFEGEGDYPPTSGTVILGEDAGGMMTEDVNVMEQTPTGMTDVNVSETEPVPTASTNEINISYEQLRDRLPPEISDDIVLLLSQSYEAFADFAEIQTQADVNEFNIKYNVQLFLPQQSGA